MSDNDALKNEFKDHIENHKNEVNYKFFNYTEPSTSDNELVPYLIPRDWIIENFNLDDLLCKRGSEMPFQDLKCI